MLEPKNMLDEAAAAAAGYMNGFDAILHRLIRELVLVRINDERTHPN